CCGTRLHSAGLGIYVLSAMCASSSSRAGIGLINQPARCDGGAVLRGGSVVAAGGREKKMRCADFSIETGPSCQRPVKNPARSGDLMPTTAIDKNSMNATTLLVAARFIIQPRRQWYPWLDLRLWSFSSLETS